MIELIVAANNQNEDPPEAVMVALSALPGDAQRRIVTASMIRQFPDMTPDDIEGNVDAVLYNLSSGVEFLPSGRPAPHGPGSSRSWALTQIGGRGGQRLFVLSETDATTGEILTERELSENQLRAFLKSSAGKTDREIDQMIASSVRG
jgi:hypothetical protein